MNILCKIGLHKFKRIFNGLYNYTRKCERCGITKTRSIRYFGEAFKGYTK